MPETEKMVEARPRERRACGTFRIPLIQPSQLGQPSQSSHSQARQASQPGQLGIEASGLQASMSAILLYRGSSPSLKGPTGGIAFWHPQHQGGQPSMPQTHQISMIWPPFQQIESWDNHFMDLGYPSKFYRVQDASFSDGSSI